jgi:outer membrane protein assembly factor BamB
VSRGRLELARAGTGLPCALAALLVAMTPGSLVAEQAARPALLWRYNAGSAVTAPPAWNGERIAFVTRSGAVALLDSDGRLQWSVALRDGTNGPAAFDASPAFASGRVIVTSARGWVSALGTNGETLWQYACGEKVRAAPLVAPAEPATPLYVLTQESGTVHCLGAQTGRLLWVSKKTNRCDGAPALAAGRILFGNCDAALYAIDAASGLTVARVELGEYHEIAAGIGVEGPLAWCGTYSGAIFCVDTERRVPVWTNNVSKSETFTTPALNDRLLVIGALNGSMYALDKASGALVWTFDCSGTPGNPVFCGESVFVGARGVLHALSAIDGKERWSIAISDEVQGPVVAGDKLLVAGDDGSLSAFRVSPAPSISRKQP